MKRAFPWAFRPDAGAIEELWNTSLIALDTNVLLLVYRMSEKSRDQLFQVMEGLGDRLWIPYQVGEEFMRNRETVLLDQRTQLDSLMKAFSDLNSLVKDDSRIPLDVEELRPITQNAKNEFETIVRRERNALADVASDRGVIPVWWTGGD